MRKLSMDELNRVSPEQFHQQRKFPLVVVLDNIRSMHNVGALFRTCDAFNVEKLYLCGITATPPHKEISKTALGATESVAWEYVEDVVNIVQQLKKQKYKVYIVEQTSQSILLNQWHPTPGEKIAIVLGNEVFGVDNRLLSECNGALEIPQYGTKHSLNVAIAGGIVIWELCRNTHIKP
ncbi:MAG: RNA methyltransferase [Bacteroidales bacterium]|jgi:tRNA G18 (ribose-2'-O)-methylase SpoU|nr:RNA methyltransferase [Bacteroidales bacterium]